MRINLGPVSIAKDNDRPATSEEIAAFKAVTQILDGLDPDTSLAVLTNAVAVILVRALRPKGRDPMASVKAVADDIRRCIRQNP